MLCPVRSIHPHPASLVRPLSSPDLVHAHGEVDGRFGNDIDVDAFGRGSSVLLEVAVASVDGAKAR